MKLNPNWTPSDLIDNDGFYFDPSKPWCIKPDSGCTCDTGPFPGGIDNNSTGTLLDCRIPAEARKEMALGHTQVLSYGEWLATQ